MTLRDCIARYEAQHPTTAPLTPLGAATVAARRLAALLPDLDPQDRQDILAQLVVNAPAGLEGMGFGLTIHFAPTPDPAA